MLATNCEYLQVLSKTVNTPFYVVGESFKFVRMYPLSQWDVPQEQSKPLPSVPVDQYHSINPMLDYTPPSTCSSPILVRASYGANCRYES